MLRPILPLVALLALGLSGCSQTGSPPSATGPSDASRLADRSTPAMHSTPSPDASNTPANDAAAPTSIATFGAGCFWCVEAVLEQLEGVIDVTSGYMGGATPNPTYEEVCSGRSGHAEVVQVRFDPARIRFEDLVDVFWELHDPTTLNRQGADVGTQYRSAIFFHDEDQRAVAERAKAAAQVDFEDPIVTEITAASTFHPAEDYHQGYYFLNKDRNPYCRAVITPKLKKLGLKH